MTRPKRIQRRRTKGWMMPENTVSVCRPGVFGNPFTVASARGAGYKNPEEVAVRAFRDWLNGIPWACGCLDTMETQRARILARLPELRGKDLACWCSPDQPCHADVLLEMANREDG
ncbi:DUF4326 domain-containing protein [Thiosulfatihalobacter marinus]|uniref:DUF4326 domain-containing protein n=1 Tax=Thiosulfatihalobacter marinus TaxID=2792481 RepID=UPI0018D5FB32|nr:DUF4326 domain-containing protein [Thiosulfatihalobacter marinus]